MECLPLSEPTTIKYDSGLGPLFDALISTEKMEITYGGKTYTSTRHRTKKGKLIEGDKIVITVPGKYKTVTLKCKLELGLRPMSREVTTLTFDHVIRTSGYGDGGKTTNVKYHGCRKKLRWE